MISREKRLIITFRCTTDAIAMEKACKAAQAPGRLIPVQILTAVNLSKNCFHSRTCILREFMNA